MVVFSSFMFYWRCRIKCTASHQCSVRVYKLKPSYGMAILILWLDHQVRVRVSPRPSDKKAMQRIQLPFRWIVAYLLSSKLFYEFGSGTYCIPVTEWQFVFIILSACTFIGSLCLSKYSVLQIFVESAFMRTECERACEDHYRNTETEDTFMPIVQRCNLNVHIWKRRTEKESNTY